MLIVYNLKKLFLFLFHETKNNRAHNIRWMDTYKKKTKRLITCNAIK